MRELLNKPQPTTTPQTTPAKITWQAVVGIMTLIVIIRECSVIIMSWLGYANLGNLLGLFLLLSFALLYRAIKGDIPTTLVSANARILKESIFAFLPISAGAGVLLIHLGNDTFKIVGIMLISTLLPMWIYARMVKKWH